jgi:hypothetical protein
MANPWLRILLVDEDHSTRMNIEKNLASLGYHRFAPLSSLHDLLMIIDSTLCILVAGLSMKVMTWLMASLSGGPVSVPRSRPLHDPGNTNF